MSVWTEVNGTIVINQFSKCSLRTLLEEHFDEITIGALCQGDRDINYRIQVTMNWMFCSNGIDAAQAIQGFCQAVKAVDPSSIVDLHADIRFYY